jgi:hypothetical protein
MANSYLDYRKESLRVNDQILTVIVLLAADVVRSDDAHYTGARLTEAWASEVLNAPPGLIDLDLKDFWETDIGNTELTSLLDRVEQTILGFGERIPSERLNALAKPSSIQFVDIETSLVLDTLRKWRNLLAVKHA